MHNTGRQVAGFSLPMDMVKPEWRPGRM